RIDVDADRRGGCRREERGAVTLAAGRIEHAPAGHELAGKRIAVPVFVGDLARDAGNVALPVEIEVGRHGRGTHLAEPRDRRARTERTGPIRTRRAGWDKR